MIELLFLHAPKTTIPTFFNMQNEVVANKDSMQKWCRLLPYKAMKDIV